MTKNKQLITELWDFMKENSLEIGKDFEDVDNNGKLSIGDIIILDPTLIVIKKASHLDSNRSFISDIYDEVKSQDGNWSEVIPAEDFVRVTFEKNLTNKNDITVYARVSNSGECYDDKTRVMTDNGYHE